MQDSELGPKQWANPRNPHDTSVTPAKPGIEQRVCQQQGTVVGALGNTAPVLVPPEMGALLTSWPYRPQGMKRRTRQMVVERNCNHHHLLLLPHHLASGTTVQMRMTQREGGRLEPVRAQGSPLERWPKPRKMCL